MRTSAIVTDFLFGMSLTTMNLENASTKTIMNLFPINVKGKGLTMSEWTLRNGRVGVSKLSGGLLVQ